MLGWNGRTSALASLGMELTARAVMEMESRWFRLPGSKDAAIRDTFDCTATVYYQRVVQIVTAPPLDVAVEYGPTITVLRRRMAARQRVTRPRAS